MAVRGDLVRKDVPDLCKLGRPHGIAVYHPVVGLLGPFRSRPRLPEQPRPYTDYRHSANNDGRKDQGRTMTGYWPIACCCGFVDRICGLRETASNRTSDVLVVYCSRPYGQGLGTGESQATGKIQLRSVSEHGESLRVSSNQDFYIGGS